MKQLTGAFHLDAPGPRQKKKKCLINTGIW